MDMTATKSRKLSPYPHSIIPSPRMAINKTPKIVPLSRFKNLPSLDLSDEEDDDADGYPQPTKRLKRVKYVHRVMTAARRPRQETVKELEVDYVTTRPE